MLVLSGEGCSNDDFDVLLMASVRWGIDVTVLFEIVFACYKLTKATLFSIISYRLDHLFRSIYLQKSFFLLCVKNINY